MTPGTLWAGLAARIDRWLDEPPWPAHRALAFWAAVGALIWIGFWLGVIRALASIG